MRDLPLRAAAFRSPIVALALGTAAVLAQGCTDDGDPSAATAGLRVIHLAPGVPDLAVFLDDTAGPIFAQVTYAGGTSYAPIAAASHDVEIAAAGVGIESTFLRVDQVPLPGDSFTTLVVIGSADVNDVVPLEALLLVDDRAGDAPGAVRVRAVHAAPGLGEADVRAIPEGGIETTLAGSLDYAEIGDYVELSTPTRYTFTVDVDRDGEADERLTVDVPDDALAMNLFVALGAMGEPLLVAQADEGNTIASGLVPEPQDQQPR